jgi:hypothetical protein
LEPGTWTAGLDSRTTESDVDLIVQIARELAARLT